MKKLLLTSALLLLSAITAFAQQRALWAGLSGAYLSGDISNTSLLTEFVNRPGYQAGAVLRHSFTDEFSAQLELNYEQRNFSTRSNILGLRPGTDFMQVCWACYFRSNVDYRSVFLVFPFTGNYEMRRERLALQVQAGLFYALLMANYHDGFEELFLDPDGMVSITNPFLEPGLYRTVYNGLSTNVINTYDAGFLLGIGLSYDIGHNTRLMLNGRTQVGVAGIFENPNMPEVNFKSYVLRFGILRKIYQQ